MTLVEVIVALVVVAVGLLGVAASSSLAMRAVSVQSMALRASARARLRITLLEAGGCTRTVDGAADDSVSHLSERWRIVTRTVGAVTVDDSLTWSSDGRTRHLVLRTALLC